MLVDSIWRALPPSYRTGICRTAHARHNWRAVPRHRLAPTWIISTKPTQRYASTVSDARPNIRSTPPEGDPAPKWTGSGVFGVAFGAALVGWGIAAMTMGRNGQGAVLLDSKKQFPRYANLKEMEIVRLSNLFIHLPTQLCNPLHKRPCVRY